MFPRKIYRITFEYDGGQGVCFYTLNRKGKLSPGNIDQIENELSEEYGVDVFITNVFEMN